MYWSLDGVAREHVRDLQREAARRRNVRATQPRARNRTHVPWWRDLMGLPSASAARTVRPAQ